MLFTVVVAYMHLAIIRPAMLYGSECLVWSVDNSINKCGIDENADQVMFLFLSKVFRLTLEWHRF